MYTLIKQIDLFSFSFDLIDLLIDFLFITYINMIEFYSFYMTLPLFIDFILLLIFPGCYCFNLILQKLFIHQIHDMS